MDDNQVIQVSYQISENSKPRSCQPNWLSKDQEQTDRLLQLTWVTNQ
jgi:hypothetical protein